MSLRAWTVAGALVPAADGLLLVANRRRSGAIEWTPPGGVVDDGESVLGALAREVSEETGLTVERWAGLRYTVQVEAPDLGWVMRVEAWEVAAYSGQVVVADPDGIVEEVRFADRLACTELLTASPPWVHIPVGEWLDGRSGAEFRFNVQGTDRERLNVQRLQ